MADQYKKHTHREHILELPDTYVGSTETHEETRWIYDSTTNKMAHKKVAFNPGFYKIFDEIIVNARDALVRSLKTTPIKHIEISNDFIFTIDGCYPIRYIGLLYSTECI